MDLEVSEDREEDCELGAKIFSECLEEGIIKRRFINDSQGRGDGTTAKRCVSKRWSFFKRAGE